MISFEDLKYYPNEQLMFCDIMCIKDIQFLLDKSNISYKILKSAELTDMGYPRINRPYVPMAFDTPPRNKATAAVITHFNPEELWKKLCILSYTHELKEYRKEQSKLNEKSIQNDYWYTKAMGDKL